jgi:Protein of unknown function (DUF2782)
MRRLLAITLVFVALAAGAQQRPPKLDPLPEPPPPPPLPAGPGEVDEPRVRIPVQEGDKLEPIRQDGRVVAVRVTPPGGKPYFLIDTTGYGGWIRRDSLDDGVRFPMFPILEFD